MPTHDMPDASTLLHGTPDNRVPQNAIAGEIQTVDGVRLRHARWPAREGTACRGTVMVFQGRCEFIEKYFEVVEELRARGFAVATLDWRGQGGSQRLLAAPLRGHVDSFESYQHDVAAFAEQILPQCPRPHYALSHSMGGPILLKCVAEQRIRFERMVLETPMLGIAIIPFQPLIRPLAALLVRCGLAGTLPPGALERPITEIPFSMNLSTSDPRRYARIAEVVQAHPVLGLGPPSWGWVHAAFQAMGELAQPEMAARLPTPMLFISGSCDRLVSRSAICRMAGRLGNARHLEILDARHEIMIEDDIYRARFWSAFDSFMA